MSYTFLTYAQTRTALSQRLFDSSKILFSDAELKVYVLEALQTFNAYARFYRDVFAFLFRNGVTWYDLTDSVNLGTSLRLLHTTDQSLLLTMEYHLLEPLTSVYPLNWTGSAQFAVTDLLNAIQQVRDQVLSETGCTISQSLVSASSGVTTLPDTTIDIRRICWLQTSGNMIVNMLHPSDFWADQSYDANFRQATGNPIPYTYRRSTAPPVSFIPDVALPGSSNYDILTINAGTTLLTTASTLLPIPDDWCWVVKWGALAQLLGRMSTSTDTVRYNYCLARYKQGIQEMQSMPALLTAQIGGLPISITAIRDADHYSANWQGLSPGTPTAVYYAGQNMVALAPQPNFGSTVNVWVVRNMVLPSLDGDFIQASRDDVQAILDYAEHIAMFKVGGSEFLDTLPLLDNFIRHCRLYNSKLSAQSLYREFLEGRAQREEQMNPVFTEPTPSTVDTKRG